MIRATTKRLAQLPTEKSDPAANRNITGSLSWAASLGPPCCSVKMKFVAEGLRPICFQAAANSTTSISVASSVSAFELLTSFDTGQRCSQDAPFPISRGDHRLLFSHPLWAENSFLSTELPLRRRLLKMIGGLATCPKNICRMTAACRTRSSSRLSKWS